MHSSSRQKEGQELFYYFISFCLPCFCAAGKSCVAFCLCVASVKSKGSVLLPLRCLLPLRLRSQKQREVKSKGKAKVALGDFCLCLLPLLADAKSKGSKEKVRPFCLCVFCLCVFCLC